MPAPFTLGGGYLGEFPGSNDVDAFLTDISITRATGMSYFSTNIDELMRWDNVRGVWLSATRYVLSFGSRGNRSQNQYFFISADTVSGNDEKPAYGIPVEDSVLIGYMYSQQGTEEMDLEIRRETAVIATLTVAKDKALHKDFTLALPFTEGRLSLKVARDDNPAHSSYRIKYCHFQIFYRRTAL